MKSFYILSFIILFYSSSIYPQWTNQNPVPNGNHLWSAFFINDNTGWIVGSQGFIKKTTNAGLDWFQQNSETSVELRDVQFMNQNIGWICGDSGLVIRTINGGQDWFEQSSGTTELLTGLYFLSSDVGYLVGYNGTILNTTNGGLVWDIQTSNTSGNLYSVDFVDSQTGYVVGGTDSTIFLKTTDGGLSWIGKTVNIDGQIKIINCVEFVSANIGYIGSGYNQTSDGTFSKTTDGGESWSHTSFSILPKDSEKKHMLGNNIILDSRHGIHSIYFKDANNGYAVGGSSNGWNRGIFSTTDGGITWQAKYHYTEQTGLLSVFVNNDGRGWAVGFAGVMYFTENNGLTWAQILSGNNVLYYTGDLVSDVFMIDENFGWACGSRKGTYIYPVIFGTTNGGKIWKTIFENQSGLHKSFSKIFFKNENIGWVVSSADEGVRYKTSDGGENWLAGGIDFNSMFFINQDSGWATQGIYGPFGGVLKSVDGGSTWVKKSSVGSSNVYFSDVNNGWAVGASGSILKSTDVGESWVSKTSGTSADLKEVKFYDNDIGICAGNSGTILVTTDAGENWIPKSGPTLSSLKFINTTTVWGATSAGEIYKTTDFGDNWSSLNTGISGGTSFFISENLGWVGGSNNIFKYFEEPIPVPIPVWTNEILVEDAGGTESSGMLTFGQHINATDSINASLGEYELPPPPIAGNFDARFNLPTNPEVSSLIDYRDSSDTDIIWNLSFQQGSSSYPFTFTWDSTSFHEGSFYLKDIIDGSYVFVNMKNQSGYTLMNPAISSLNISYRGSCSSVSVNNEWNMVSTPLLAEDMSLSNLYPTAISDAYGYEGGYVSKDTLVGGKGYWLKFGQSEDIPICGLTLGNTVSLGEGWNMFGVYDDDILVNQITTTPPGIIATYLFGFEDGYKITDTLKSGKGYWVRVTEDGVINLNGGGLSTDRVQEQIAKLDQNWGMIKITDNEGKSINLFATEEEIQSSLYELPPIPPSGIFDVRYSSGKIVENFSSSQVIRISSDNYPITIKAEGLNITLNDIINGKLLNEELKNGEKIRITNNKITSILLTGRITEGLPIAYELSQNYPNPFNPSTTIKFAVPKESRVNLSIYNILGELVSTVLNEQMKAGYYDYELNASNLASGVYLYRIKAGDYVETKKMVLLR